MVLRPQTKDCDMTIKLNDLQRMLLSTASQTGDHQLDGFAHGDVDASQLAAAIASLVRRKLVANCDGTEANGERTYRITDAGLAAIGVVGNAQPTDCAAADAPAAPQTKVELIIGLMKRTEGATLDQMVAATGWLPHTTRAALTGLRKRGHGIARTATDDGSVYRIGAAA
jgi:hypothetical protein